MKTVQTCLKFSGLIFIGLIVVTEFSTIHSAYLRYPVNLDNPRLGLQTKESANLVPDSLSPLSLKGMIIPSPKQLSPNMTSFSSDASQEIETFLNLPLNQYPSQAGFLSEKLNTSYEIIAEAQRLHFNILGEELKKYTYAILVDFAAFENKGDPAISVGEIYFLMRMNIKILYHCSVFSCSREKLLKAKTVVQNYSPKDLVILGHGGGNIIGYPLGDSMRFHMLEVFKGYKFFVFPQSIWIKSWTDPQIKKTQSYYRCNPDLTMVLRDRQSYGYAKRLYNGTTRLLMAPDMAFQFGHVSRIMSPVFDILWIKRKDAETAGYKPPTQVPKDLRVHIADWYDWPTPSAKLPLERAFYIATNGFFFLQRGRVVITDRLHGHIMCVLMNIPHVLVDNKAKKLSAYHNSWTKSLKNIVITDDPTKAIGLAIELLKKFNDELPLRVSYLDLHDDLSPPKLGIPEYKGH